MNIFGIGGAELVLIILIALVVAGPKRMIHWAYILGQYVGKLRVMWSQVVDVVQREIDEAGVDVKLPKDLPTRQTLNQTLSQAIKPLSDSMEKAAREVQESVPDLSAMPANNAVPTMRPGEMLTAGKKLMQVNKTADTASAPLANDKATPSPAPAANLGAWGGARTSEDSPPPAAPSRFGTWAQPAQASAAPAPSSAKTEDEV